jgi:Beta-galactosidase/beta-glucuronidase
MKRILFLLLILLPVLAPARERVRFDDGWEFAFGNAASPALDFGCGTEYFNYLTKAASIHNEGPYTQKFDKAKWPAEWKSVTLPHDWVVDLPFAREASHSHGYKTVGFNYPETSVGWYRKTFTVPAGDEGKHFTLQFDGIFRNADIWVNGFWLGKEPSGYATQVYDISEYLDYGAENLVCIRVDASLEEGWFYEGAGIYRHVWLEKTAPVHVAPFGTFVHTSLSDSFDRAFVTVETTIRNSSAASADYTLQHTLLNADGAPVASAFISAQTVLAKADSRTERAIAIDKPHLWSLSYPYLYKVRTEVLSGDKVIDTYETPFGIRSVVFDADQGFFLNGERVEIKGVNLHQDHAGVGAAIPDALQVYRLKELKKIGVNAVRTSHNPATPEMMDACDSLGILVLEENRLTGVNDEHIRLLKRMIERDRNHPSIILWSIGNEEWGTEWKDKGTKITESMREYCHRLDPTRLMTVASSSGPHILITADVAGYNYVHQHKIDDLRAQYPARKAVGTEETTGSGTRGVYFDDEKNGRMAALNRRNDTRDSTYNVIGRGWKYYLERPWLGGLFYWTGLDYRGEPNPLSFPATGSEFGILDYCGFPKDEAFYLKAWWTDEPVLHVFPHWNLPGHEGEKISVWVYSNCDEVELSVNGKRLGRKKMVRDGYLSWEAVYRPGKVVATGYKKGRKVLVETIETTEKASAVALEADRTALQADGRDLAVVTVCLKDRKGRFVPNACEWVTLEVNGPARILGVGNGDPAWQEKERPDDPDARTFRVRTFNGLAQVLVQSDGAPGVATLTVSGTGLASAALTIGFPSKN